MRYKYCLCADKWQPRGSAAQVCVNQHQRRAKHSNTTSTFRYLQGIRGIFQKHLHRKTLDFRANQLFKVRMHPEYSNIRFKIQGQCNNRVRRRRTSGYFNIVGSLTKYLFHARVIFGQHIGSCPQLKSRQFRRNGRDRTGRRQVQQFPKYKYVEGVALFTKVWGIPVVNVFQKT